MTIRQKIYILLAIVLTVLTVQGIWVLRASQGISNDNAKLAQHYDPMVSYAKAFQLDVVQIQQWLTDISATRGLDGLNDGFDVAKEHYDAATQSVASIRQLDDVRNVNYEQVQKALDQFYLAGKRMAEAYIAGGPSLGNLQMLEFDKAAEAMAAKVEQVLHHAEAEKALINQRVMDSTQLLTQMIVVSLVLNIALVWAVLFVVSQQLLSPLAKLRHSVANLSQGNSNLTERLEVPRNDEVGLVSIEFNRILDKISTLVEWLMAHSGSLDQVSTRLSSSAKSTLKDARSQENQIHLIAAALTELSANSSEVGASAESIRDLVAQSSTKLHDAFNNIQRASKTVGNLQNQIANASGSLAGLQDRTDEIGSVLGVIKAIAEQTNLLALNAAIEAARAGEQGRGFAVVADEVRALASRTQDSTTEINHIIQQLQDAALSSIDHMNECQSAVADTVAETDHTLSGIRFVHDSMDDIAEKTVSTSYAINQQCDVIEEHTKTSLNILTIAAKTAAMVSDISKDSEVLKNEAEGLVGIANSFGSLR